MTAVRSACSRATAIVGVGETDYRADYLAARREGPGHEPPGVETLQRQAFDRAVSDSGVRRDDVDALIHCVDDGAPAADAVAKMLGIEPRFARSADSILPLGIGGQGVIPTAVEALVNGECDTIAILYAAAPRTRRKQFGGDTYLGTGRDSYYYYHPWGWSSQAAHWALIATYYARTYGTTEADLGSVAVAARNHAMLNDNAIMRGQLTVDHYLASPYVVKPLRRLDLCLPNDGAVCLIMRRTEDASHLPHPPAVVAGWADSRVPDTKMCHLVKDRLRAQLRDAGGRALAMAGLSLSDIDHFGGYDASTIHLVNQVEGYGFVEPGTGLRYCEEGQLSLGGTLPTNTNGGMLSEAYMHGWNHLVEATRQLRHEAGPRQVQGIETSMFSVATTDSAHPLILVRGGSRG